MGASRFQFDTAQFDDAVDQLARMNWRPEIKVEEIGSPQRIAPYSVAISADIIDQGEDLGTGRLILLHDPAGNDAWGGTFRLVSFVRADVELEMVADPLLPEVGWAWLTDSLAINRAEYIEAAGTVTAVYSKGFGEMGGQEDRAELELRASWTPLLSDEQPLIPHLFSWQDLMCHLTGIPPLPAGVVPLAARNR